MSNQNNPEQRRCAVPTGSAFFVSDCGKYIARRLGNTVNFDVMTIDGTQCWLARRYEPKGWKDKDPRYTHPEFAQATGSYSLEVPRKGQPWRFTLGFLDLDQRKRIKPLTGNCVVKSYTATFSRRMKLHARPLKLNTDSATLR